MSTQQISQWIEAAVWLRLSGDVDSARQMLQKVIRVDPNHAEALRLLSELPVAKAGIVHSSFVQPPPQNASILGAKNFVLPPSIAPVQPHEAIPPRSTPRQFLADIFEQPEVPIDLEPAASTETELDVPVATESQAAWAWSPPVEPPSLGVQVRESGLIPSAQSAWDSGSNPGVKLRSVSDQGRALDLVAPTEQLPIAGSPDDLEQLIATASERIDLDDHTGALEVLAKAEGLAPENTRVRALKAKSETILLSIWESKIGNMAAIPKVVMKDDEIIWLSLDHRAGFILAQIDGTVSYSDLFAVSGMSRTDTARIVVQLLEARVIGPSK